MKTWHFEQPNIQQPIFNVKVTAIFCTLSSVRCLEVVICDNKSPENLKGKAGMHNDNTVDGSEIRLTTWDV